MLSSLSIFVPAYRDEATIGALAEKSLAVIRRVARQGEVIIVDDASPDRSGAIADELAARHPGIRVVHHPVNLGVGGAMRTGYESAVMDWVFYTDGDAQYDVDELEKLTPFAGEFRVIVGYRIKRADAPVRFLLSRCYHLLLFLAFPGFHVRDVDASFKLIRRELLARVPLRSQSGFLDAELLLRLQRQGEKIKEVGVSHHPRRYGHSQCFRWRVVAAMLRDIFLMRLGRL